MKTMREIKFRAWDEKLKRWECWALPEDAGYLAGRFNKQNATKKGRRFSSLTFSQYTGLKDKNGNEIYEGDIIRTVGGVTKEVAFDKYLPGFVGLVSYPGAVDVNEEEIEVIGNIYENPEFIK